MVREGLPEEVTSEQRPGLAREEPYCILVRLTQPKDEETNLRCLARWSSGEDSTLPTQGCGLDSWSGN